MQDIQTLIIINQLKHWPFLEETLLSLDLKKEHFFIMKSVLWCWFKYRFIATDWEYFSVTLIDRFI